MEIIRHCYADTSKISALGFEPELSLKEGLTDLVAWGDQQTAVSRIEDAHQGTCGQRTDCLKNNSS